MLAVELLLRLRKRSRSAIKMADINSVLLTDLKKRLYFETSGFAAECLPRHLHKGKTAGNDELTRLRSWNALPTPVQCRLYTDMYSFNVVTGHVCASSFLEGKMVGWSDFGCFFLDFSCVLVLWISFSPIDFARPSNRVVFMQLFASLRLTCRFRYVTLCARVPGTGRCCLVARKTTRRAPVVFF